MSKFIPGESGNPSGRPKGKANRNITEIREALLTLLSNNLEKLQNDLTLMKARDRANLLINLAKHVVPPAVNPDRLTEDQIEQVIEYLKYKQQDEKE